MKKKLKTPATTEAPAPQPIAERPAPSPYVLLPDGSPARRLKPITISGRRYWNLALDGNGKVKRVPDDKLLDHCEII